MDVPDGKREIGGYGRSASGNFHFAVEHFWNVVFSRPATLESGSQIARASDGRAFHPKFSVRELTDP